MSLWSVAIRLNRGAGHGMWAGVCVWVSWMGQNYCRVWNQTVMGSFGRQLARVNVLWRDEVILKWNLGPDNVFKWKRQPWAEHELNEELGSVWGAEVGRFEGAVRTIKLSVNRNGHQALALFFSLSSSCTFLKQESSLCLSGHGGRVILLRAVPDKALHCALQIYEIISCIIKENTNMRVWQHEMSLWRTALKLSTKAPMIFNTRHMFNITARINSAMARSCPELSGSKSAVMTQKRGLERTDLYALLH